MILMDLWDYAIMYMFLFIMNNRFLLDVLLLALIIITVVVLVKLVTWAKKLIW